MSFGLRITCTRSTRRGRYHMMRIAPNVLFTPWGNGNGHLMRMIVLARHAESQGASTTIAVADEGEEKLVQQNGISTYRYTHRFIDVDPWMAWADASFVAHAIGSDRLMIRNTSPDIVVSDSRLSMHMAAAMERVPVTAVVQDMDFPGYCYPGRPREQLWAQVEVALKSVFTTHKWVYEYADPRELMQNAGVIVPGIPELEEIPRVVNSEAVFVGPLTGHYQRSRASPTLHQDGTILFYRIVSVDTIDEFIRAFNDILNRAVVATGDPRVTETLAPKLRGTGARVLTLWNTSEEGGASPSCAIIHGGHGTLLHMAQAGVPTIVVPDLSPERYANALKAEMLPSMTAVTSGLHPVDLTWNSQGNQIRVVRHDAVRRALDAFDLTAARSAASALARRLQRYTIGQAWRAIVAESRVPTLHSDSFRSNGDVPDS